MPLPPPETRRINKRLAELGLCSRRDADAWIAAGWVWVNGLRAEIGQSVSVDDQIRIDRAAVRKQEAEVTILLNKPIGYVSGQPEDGHPAAVSLIVRERRFTLDASPRRFARQHLDGLAPAGRLDIDSTGLLVLTQDGRIARQLIGETSQVEKEYLVRVRFGETQRAIDKLLPATSLEKLRHGLCLDGRPLAPATVYWQNSEQLTFILTEGKKRQIRRMCEAVGLTVVALKRVRIGRVRLADLPMGNWRYLADHERF